MAEDLKCPICGQPLEFIWAMLVKIDYVQSMLMN